MHPVSAGVMAAGRLPLQRLDVMVRLYLLRKNQPPLPRLLRHLLPSQLPHPLPHPHQRP